MSADLVATTVNKLIYILLEDGLTYYKVKHENGSVVTFRAGKK